ncbi:MAG: hypothetical protein E7812_01710 [Phenylobacterium sp.]|nr:MAG: hypothetical protein E7812_01710 [Phenylobacterium sp.]
MRALLVLTAALFASPAIAQRAPLPPVAITPPIASWQYNALLVQQEEARQRAIQQDGQLNALDAQLRVQQSIADLQAQRNPPRIPAPDPASGPPYPQIDASQLADIPDAALAASNQRVLDVAGAPD